MAQLEAVDTPVKEVRARMVRYAQLADENMIGCGLTYGHGRGSGRSSERTHGVTLSESFFVVDAPIRHRIGFRKFINTAIFHTLKPVQENQSLIPDLEYGQDFAVATLVVDDVNEFALKAVHRVHVPARGYDRLGEVMNHLGQMAGEYPHEVSPDFVDIDWDVASGSDIYDFDGLIAGIVDRAKNSGSTWYKGYIDYR